MKMCSGHLSYLAGLEEHNVITGISGKPHLKSSDKEHDSHLKTSACFIHVSENKPLFLSQI